MLSIEELQLAFVNKDYIAVKGRVLSRTLAHDVLANLDFAGFWVKDKDYKFLEISTRASKILYNTSSNYCIGKTDIDLVKKKDSKYTDLNLIKVCRASDIITKETSKTCVFIEFLNSSNGNTHIWKVFKNYINLEGNYYYVGFASFMDELLGSYEVALKWVDKEMFKLEKINNSLYVYNYNYLKEV
jgi:hypothetical protein